MATSTEMKQAIVALMTNVLTEIEPGSAEEAGMDSIPVELAPASIVLAPPDAELPDNPVPEEIRAYAQRHAQAVFDELAVRLNEAVYFLGGMFVDLARQYRQDYPEVDISRFLQLAALDALGLPPAD